MKRFLMFILSLQLLFVLISNSQAQNEDFMTRISIVSDGTQANGKSSNPSISQNGELIVFTSQADNLVPNDTNGYTDLFIKKNDQLLMISLSDEGIQANNSSGAPKLSVDGRYVAFISYASNLVPNDTNGESDIFVHDLETSTTKRVSVASDGTQANQQSREPNISGDGRYLVFTSLASNLVALDKNDALDVFVHDQQTAQTRIVSVTPEGTSGSYHSTNPVISADGRFIAFQSWANDLACCSSGFYDIFVRDMNTAQTTHISKAYDGGQTNDRSATEDISADGRYILFSSLASNLVKNDFNPYCPVGGSPNPSCRDIFVYDQETGELAHVSVASDGTQANDYSHRTTISPDGRYVAFWSAANNLSSHDNYPGPDLFVHDLTTGETKLVSIGYNGSQGNYWAYPAVPDFSADGTLLAFSSAATNLVPNDTNEKMDVFISRWQEVTRIYRLYLPQVRQ